MPIAEVIANGDDNSDNGNSAFWLVIVIIILLLIACDIFSNNIAAAIQNAGIIISKWKHDCIVVVSPLLPNGELLTVLSGGSDNSLLSVVPPLLSITGLLSPIDDGLMPLVVVVVSGGVEVSVLDDGDVSTFLVLGDTDARLLSIDAVDGGLLLLSFGISPGIAGLELVLSEGTGGVDRYDALVHEESLGFVVQSGSDGGVVAVGELEQCHLNLHLLTNQIQIYKGLGHAFANPSGANYAPQQTADAWEKTLAFLKKYV
jgi:hypothetical protein